MDGRQHDSCFDHYKHKIFCGRSILRLGAATFVFVLATSNFLAEPICFDSSRAKENILSLPYRLVPSSSGSIKIFSIVSLQIILFFPSLGTVKIGRKEI